MRVIGMARIETYVDDVLDADAAFFAAWIAEAKLAQWTGPTDIERTFPLADVNGSEVTFYIAGERHALATTMNYEGGIMLIRSVQLSKRAKRSRAAVDRVSGEQ